MKDAAPMLHDIKDLNLDFEEIDENFAQFRGLPIHTYTDQKIYDFEIDTIFEGSWQFLCPVAKVSKPGDIYEGRIGRSNVFVTRNADGELRGFLNFCRHRGFKLVEENASDKKLIRCRYHAWAFDLNGELRAAPNTDDQPGFKKCDHSLIPISVTEWGPIVMVNTDPDARSLFEEHPQIKRWVEKYGVKTDPEHYEEYVEKTIHQQSNWKLWYDNGTECYHCNTIHSASFGEAFDVRDGNYSFELEGGMTSYSFASTEQLLGDELRSLTYASYQIFPGLQLIQQDDLMVLGRMTPTGPDSCDVTVFYMKEKTADLARVDRWIEVWHKTFEEDGEVAEVQQSNMTSPHAKVFQYVESREEPTIFINRVILQAYKDRVAKLERAEEQGC